MEEQTQVNPEQQEQKNQPEKKIKAGGVTITVWKNIGVLSEFFDRNLTFEI